VLVSLLVAAGLLAGCSEAQDPTVIASGPDPYVVLDSYTFDPEEFGVPVFEGFQQTERSSRWQVVTGPEGRTRTLQFVSSASVTDVVQFYRSVMDEVTQEAVSETMGILRGRRGSVNADIVTQQVAGRRTVTTITARRPPEADPADVALPEPVEVVESPAPQEPGEEGEAAE
jgi:hypothetical protein